MAKKGNDSEGFGDYEREWLIFGNTCYYPEGGLTDLVGRFDSYKTAKTKFDEWLLRPTKPERVPNQFWGGKSEDCWAQLIAYVPTVGFITLEQCVSHYNWITRERRVEKADED